MIETTVKSGILTAGIAAIMEMESILGGMQILAVLPVLAVAAILSK